MAVVVVAFVLGFSSYQYPLALTLTILILAIGFEAVSVPLLHPGYISLATPIYLFAMLEEGVTQPQAVSHGIMLAALPLATRLAYPSLPTMVTRAAYFGLNIVRMTLVGVVLLVGRAGLENIVGSGGAATVAAALGAALAWIAIDHILVTPVVMANEEASDQSSWSCVLERSRFLLPLPLAIAILGSQPDFPGPKGLLGLVLASLTIFPFRGALKYSIDELVVREQEELDLNVKSLQHQNEILKSEKNSLKDESERMSTELKYVYEMARALGASTNLEDTVAIVLSMIRRLRVPYQSCVILLYRKQALVPILSETPYKDLLAMSHLLQLEESLISEVVEQQRPRLESEMSASSEGRIFKDERSVMCVPLVVGKEIVGVIYVGSVRPGTHKEEHLDTLKMLAAFAAPSVKTAMLFEQAEEDLKAEVEARKAVEAMNKRLAGLQKMGQKMGENLSIRNTMTVVASGLTQMIPDAQSVIMFNTDRESGDKHAMKAEFTLTPYADYVKNLALRDDEGLLGKAIETGKTQMVPDTHVYDVQNLLAFERSVVVAPLMVRTENGEETEILGCLYVGASKENAFNEEHQQLIETVSYSTAMAIKNARLYEQTQQMALTDGLTGLYTHRLFQEKLAAEIEWSERHNRPFCLVMVDTDNFKTFNDTLGHPAGDSLLKEIAVLLKDKVRSTDIVCRYGGDEFALLLKETDKEKALTLCERVREAFQLRFGRMEVQVTASIGLACFPFDAKTKKDLAKAADDALYVSKRGGRNRVTASKSLHEREKNPIVQETLPR